MSPCSWSGTAIYGAVMRISCQNVGGKKWYFCFVGYLGAIESDSQNVRTSMYTICAMVERFQFWRPNSQRFSRFRMYLCVGAGQACTARFVKVGSPEKTLVPGTWYNSKYVFVGVLTGLLNNASENIRYTTAVVPGTGSTQKLTWKTTYNCNPTKYRVTYYRCITKTVLYHRWYLAFGLTLRLGASGRRWTWSWA